MPLLECQSFCRPSISLRSARAWWRALVCSAALMDALGARAAAPIPVADFVRVGNFSAPALSPNGKYLVVTQRTAMEPRDQYATVVYELEGMKIVSAVRAGAAIVPLRHAWVNDMRIVTTLGREFGTVGEPESTGELVAANTNGLGSQYLYGYQKINDEGFGRLAQIPRSLDGHVLMSENPWGATARTSRLYDINTVNAARRTVTEIAQPGFGFLIQADGRPRFAYGYDDNADYAVYKFDDAKREWQPFTSAEKGDLRPVALSLDNSKLLGSLSLQHGPRSLVREGIDGSGRITLAQDPSGNIDQLEWGLRDQGPFAAGTSVGAPKLTYFDAERSDAALHKQLSAQFPGAYVHFIGVSRDGGRTLFNVRSDRDPGAVYVFDAPSGKATLLFESRPWIQPERMTEQRPIKFKARDGVELHGYLTLPAERGDAKLPLVLVPHGGPHGVADDWFFDTDAQFLASRGYAVLQVNFRGSGGRGPAFESDGHRRWGTRIQEDLIDGVRWAIAERPIDAGRICAFGASFGAYASLMVSIRAPELFKCAVGYAGLYDLQAIYDEPGTKARRQVFNHWVKVIGQDPTELAANSPSRLADRIKVPVLLAHGGADSVTPPLQAEAMRDALVKAGRPPEWLMVSGEGHGYFAEKNRQMFYEKLEAFLAKHIGR